MLHARPRTRQSTQLHPHLLGRLGAVRCSPWFLVAVLHLVVGSDWLLQEVICLFLCSQELPHNIVFHRREVADEGSQYDSWLVRRGHLPFERGESLIGTVVDPFDLLIHIDATLAWHIDFQQD